MKKLLLFALAAVCLATIIPEASASAPVAAPVTQSGPTVLPGTAFEAPVVIVTHRRYRYVRRAYYYHGVRRYRSVRIYL